MDLNLDKNEHVELKKPHILGKDSSKLARDDKQRVDVGVLKIKACLEPNYVIQNIDRFKLTKRERSNIARILLKQAKHELLLNLECFMPLCEDVKIGIAKSVARDNDVSVVKYLTILDIQDEQERINLAKLEIARKSEYVLEFLKLFKIQDGEKVIEILKDVATIDKDVSMLFMLDVIYQQNHLTDLKSWVDIMLQVMSNVCTNENFGGILPSIGLMAEQIEQDCDRCNNRVDIMRDSLKSLEKLFYCTHKEIGKINDIYKSQFEIDKILGYKNTCMILTRIDNISNETLKDRLIKLTSMMFFIINNNRDSVLKNPNVATKLICVLIDLRSENLKLKFLPYVARAISEDKLDIIKREDDKNPKTLACLYSIIFDRFGLYQPECSELLDKLRSVVYKSKIKKNAILTQNILDKLLCLDNVALTPQERQNVITFLCENSRDLKQNLTYLHQIISFGEDCKLAQIDAYSKPTILEDIGLSIYGKMGLNNDDLEYLNEFRECMYNNTDRELLQYVGLYITKNRHIKDMEATLKRFVNSIASGKRMREQRYNVSNIEHLNELKKRDSRVFEKWVSDYTKIDYVDHNEVSITDDAIDLFLIGTEVSGSCQNIDSVGSTLNKCLMGYVMDGKNKACVIKDGNGKILARSIIRILIDKKKNSAVLVKEPLYCVSNQKIRETSDVILRQKCIEYANWLGVTLVEKNCDGHNLYPNKLYSMGSNVAYEYVDSARNICRHGVYEISDMSYV